MPVRPVEEYDSDHYDSLRAAIKAAKTPEEEAEAYKAATDYKLSFVPASTDTADEHDHEPAGQPAG